MTPAQYQHLARLAIARFHEAILDSTQTVDFDRHQAYLERAQEEYAAALILSPARFS